MRQNSDGSAISIAAEDGKLPMLKTLLDLGAKPNLMQKDGDRTLHHAIYNGHTEVVTLLLEQGVDIELTSSCGLRSLHLACCGTVENTDIVDLLLNRNAQIHARCDAQNSHRGNTALHFAALNGHRATAKKLLDRGASPLAKNSSGTTPIDIANSKLNGASKTSMMSLLTNRAYGAHGQRQGRNQQTIGGPRGLRRIGW